MTPAHDARESLDTTDVRILRMLQGHPRATAVGIADTLQLARSTVQTRLARLEALGVLSSEHAHRVPALLGYDFMAYVLIEVSQRDFDRLGQDLRKIPEVLEAHGITGDGDVLCKIVAKDARDLGRITAAITDCHGVQRSQTSVVIRDILGHRLEPLLTQASDPRRLPHRS